jgi:hypothetical protein
MIHEYIYWLLYTLGITYVLSASSFGALYRSVIAMFCRFYIPKTISLWIEAFIYCPACTGFWVGCLMWALPAPHYFYAPLDGGIVGMLAGLLVLSRFGVAPDELEREAAWGWLEDAPVPVLSEEESKPD